MNYAKLLKTSFSILLSLPPLALVFAVNAKAVDVATYSDGAFPVYYNADMTPDEAYRQLVAGNARYLKEDSASARSLPRISTVQNRFPIASVIYSSDMPINPTVLTQTSDRDLYLTAIDSGAVSEDDLTSIEYGLINLQTPLLVVMGHYPSRTVSTLIRQYDVLESRAKAESVRLSTSPTIPQKTTSEQMRLYNIVGPAIARSKEAYPDIQGYDLANVVSEALVWQSLETILMKSTVAQDLVRAGRLNVIAAITDDKTGKIYWLGAHPLQDEFLKPLPASLVNKEANGILTEADLPAPLDDSVIQEYVSLYESDPYYEDVVSEYYTVPIYYQPSWELFSPRAWIYRPWYGVWYASFIPWPYWSPWGVPYGESVLGVSRWDNHLSFFVAYNRNYGVPVYYDPHFRPHDPWWGSDYFVRLDRRRHDVVFDFIIDGRRHDVPVGPPPGRNPHERHGYRPGAARPGIVVGLGGLSIGISGSPRRPTPEPGRPGGPVGPGPRVGFDGHSRPDLPRPSVPMSPVGRPRPIVPRANSPERPFPRPSAPQTAPSRNDRALPETDRPGKPVSPDPRTDIGGSQKPTPVRPNNPSVRPNNPPVRPNNPPVSPSNPPVSPNNPPVRPNNPPVSPNNPPVRPTPASERPTASPRGARPSASSNIKPSVGRSLVERNSGIVPSSGESRFNPPVRFNPRSIERPETLPRETRPSPRLEARSTETLRPVSRGFSTGTLANSHLGSTPTPLERHTTAPREVRPHSDSGLRPNDNLSRSSNLQPRPTPSSRSNFPSSPRIGGSPSSVGRSPMGHGTRPF